MPQVGVVEKACSELEAAGLRPMTPEEMQARYPNRLDSGVPLYFDPVRAADVRRRLRADAQPAAQPPAEAGGIGSGSF